MRSSLVAAGASPAVSQAPLRKIGELDLRIVGVTAARPRPSCPATSPPAYYTERESEGIVASRWHGKGASQLGLSGRVKADDFARLLAGQDPSGRRVLVAHREGKDERRAGWDVTISPHKSVSLQALALYRGKGVAIVAGVQSLGLMRAVYGEDEWTALGDAFGSLLVLAANMPAELRRKVTDQVGKWTLLHEHESSSRNSPSVSFGQHGPNFSLGNLGAGRSTPTRHPVDLARWTSGRCGRAPARRSCARCSRRRGCRGRCRASRRRWRLSGWRGWVKRWGNHSSQAHKAGHCFRNQTVSLASGHTWPGSGINLRPTWRSRCGLKDSPGKRRHDRARFGSPMRRPEASC